MNGQVITNNFIQIILNKIKCIKNALLQTLKYCMIKTPERNKLTNAGAIALEQLAKLEKKLFQCQKFWLGRSSNPCPLGLESVTSTITLH